MSGLLERIVRRRRASASSRLGPPTENGHPSPVDLPYLNGHATGLAVTHVNGSNGVVDSPAEAVAIAAEAPDALEVIDVPGDRLPGIDVPEPEPEHIAPPGAPEAVEVLPLAHHPEPAESSNAQDLHEVPDALSEPSEAQMPPDVPEAPAPLEALDEPAPIEDEPPTMEHRVLVLDEPELAAVAAEGLPAPGATETEPVPEGPADDPKAALAPPVPATPEPPFRGRARIRRRARYLRRLREIQLRDIGGFALELHRFGRDRPDLLQAKVADAAHTDAELRALEQALGRGEPLRELREAGIGGVCGNCGALHGSEDRFCATCGEVVGRSSGSARPGELDDYFSQG